MPAGRRCEKLEYVDELMAEIAAQQADAHAAASAVDPLSQLTTTLASTIDKKQALYAVDTPRTYDRDLQRIFSADPRHRRFAGRPRFIRRHRAKVPRAGGEVDRRISAHARRRAR